MIPRRPTPTTAVAAAVLLLAACGGGDGPTPTQPTPPPPNPTTTIVPPQGATVQMVRDGDAMFNGGSCQACHGIGGKNGPYGPHLTDATWLHIGGSWQELIAIVTTGVPAEKFKSPASRPQFWMFPRGGQNLTDDQIRAVAAYVWTLSHKGGGG